MELYGIGFSNIRFANDSTNMIHCYNYITNTFSEEVFIHEFLHTLERISKEHGYDTVDLHDYENYGYEEGYTNGLQYWYRDYMKCNIFDKNTKKYVGLNDEVYKYKPANEDNFRFAVKVDFNDEPDNIFQDIRSLFNVVTDAI